ncbi:MAG: hypothetical protein ACTHJ0_09740 [Flavipsychrobacter sp.]
MARTIAQIQQAIIDAKTADPNLSDLSSTSNVAIWRLWTYIVAFCQWTLETYFDLHVNEVKGIIAAQKPHTLQWYVTIAKAFQYGYSLAVDSDTYSIIDPTAQIVNYAAAIEYTDGIKGLRIKVATLNVSSLAPLSTPQLTAFTAYMQQIKDAGVRLSITSGNPDSLKLSLNIYYDALVLDGTGARLDGTANTPVQDAIDAFLANIDFNGLYVNYELLEALKAVDGVIIPELTNAQANYGIRPYVTLFPTYTDIGYIPDAGYLKIYNRTTDLTLNFIPHGII